MNNGSIGKEEGQIHIAVDDIIPDPNQPRKTFTHDALSNLAHSLQETGQIAPIVVRPGSDGKYMVVVGERRWRAAKEAGMRHVECIIRNDVDAQKALEIQLAENYQREDISPLEQARSLMTYIDRYQLSQSELSRRTGIPQRTISNRLALLSLPVSLQARIESGDIGPFEALKINALPAEQREAVTEAVASGEIGGRDLEEMTHQYTPDRNKRARNQDKPTKAMEIPVALSRRLENMERAVFEILTTYIEDRIGAEFGESGLGTLPCPECLRRGGKSYIQSVKRIMTSRDHKELEEIVSSEALGPPPTHIIEARCRQCGYTKTINYFWE